MRPRVDWIPVVMVVLLPLIALFEQRGVSPLRSDPPCRIEITSLQTSEQAIVQEALMMAAHVIREPADLVPVVPGLVEEEQRKAARLIRQAAAIMGVEVRK